MISLNPTDACPTLVRNRVAKSGPNLGNIRDGTNFERRSILLSEIDVYQRIQHIRSVKPSQDNIISNLTYGSHVARIEFAHDFSRQIFDVKSGCILKIF